jgi:hypothetical protein
MGRWRDWAAVQSAESPVRIVSVTLPADRDFLALTRTSLMHVASVLLFPLERVKDLRLAVDEACSSFLRAGDEQFEMEIDMDSAPPDLAAAMSTMELSFDVYPEFLHVTVRAPASDGWPDREDLGWEMLRTLVADVRVSIEDGVGTLTLVEPLPTAADL